MGLITPTGVMLMIVLGITLVLAVLLSKSITVPLPTAMSFLLRFASRVLIAVGMLGVALMLTPVLGLIGWLVVMGVWIRIAIHSRDLQKRSLFAALSLAADKDMPLAPMVLAFAGEQDGVFGWRARELADRLGAGMPLAEAVDSSSRALPAEAPMVARVGLESGDLAGAFQASLRSRFDRTLLRSAMSRVFYIVPAIVLFVVFMQIKIMPSYVKIFDDFDMPLPPVSIGVIRATNVFSTFGLLLVFLAVGWLALIWMQWRGWLRPRTPGLKRIVNWVEMGLVLRILALAARRECSLPRMLTAVSASHPKRAMRQRLREVVVDINEGSAWQKSLQMHGLIGRSEAALLAAAQRNGNLSWALAEMADSFDRRANYRMQALAQVALPLLLLPVGLLVCVLVMAFVSPLSALINNLT
jgi:type II secretory pathway component PulF